MRPDNGETYPATNGVTGKKSSVSGSVNGHSPHINGARSHTNGSEMLSPGRTQSTYYGHSREEVTRILIQGLRDMGYDGAATSLSQESGYELETPSVAAFRSAILEGQWTEAEGILLGSHPNGGGGVLVLAEGADRGQMLFWMRQQKFLELLEQRELGMALMVLRQELTPLHHDIHQLHALSSLLMCPAEDLKAQAHWHGSVDDSRRSLLQDLTKSISPSVMIPDHRLAELLDQVKRSQINNCLYHNTSITPSLYSDHMCNRNDFPLRTMLELDHHTQEVWFLHFSHDGSRLATASQDQSVIIYDTNSFAICHRLAGHGGEVTFLAWSPDDSRLITCSLDTKARVWDTTTGQCVMTVDHRSNQNHPVSGASWAPDSLSFVTCCLDRGIQLCHWNLQAKDADPNMHSWNGGYRAQDCAVSSDGERLVVIDSERNLYVYNFQTYEQEYHMSFSSKPTSLTISKDSKSMLVNLTSGEVQLLDIETAELIRRFEGHKQGHFVIRSTFGGAAENFVLSGSEDSKIYIWHKENGALVETLRGHGGGCVNAVAWNPRDSGMFASAGDDRRVRIWSSSVSTNGALAGTRRSHQDRSYARTSDLRSTSWGNNL